MNDSLLARIRFAQNNGAERRAAALRQLLRNAALVILVGAASHIITHFVIKYW